MYDPPGVGGTGVIYVLHDVTNPEAYGGLPKDPQIPWVVRLWKGPAKWIGNLAMVGGVVGVVLHYMRFGPKRVEEQEARERRRIMSASQVIPEVRVRRRIVRYTLR